MTSLVGELAARAAAVASGPVPDHVLATARAHLTDTVGALVAGYATLGDRLAADLPWAGGGTRRAAFVGGVYAHCWEAADIHRGSVLCPGCVVLPATLAVLAERPTISAPEFERAYLAGYEVALAAAAAVGGDALIRQGWWPTALLAPLGAAAAVSILLGHPPEVTASAIALAAQHAGGTVAGTTEGADGRYLLSGFAAERAVTAALAADDGWTGPLDILDDPRSPLRRAVPAPVPGTEFLLPETSLKPHAGAKHLQAAVDALLDLRDAAGGWSRGEIRQLTCRLPGQLAGIVDRPPPFGSPLRALGSAQFVLAVAALRGHCTPWDFDGIDDVEVLEVAEVVRVEPDGGLSAGYPARWGAAVEVVTSGSTAAAARREARGDPAHRLSEEEIVAKFGELAGRVFGSGRARGMARSLLRPRPGPPTVLRDHILPLVTEPAGGLLGAGNARRGALR